MIRTKRLLLRPARPDDLEAFHDIFTDPQTMRYWDRPPYTDISETQTFLSKFMNRDDTKNEEYVLDLDGRCVGKAGVWAIPEIGYILHRDLWGQGYVVEALEAIIPRVWDKWPDLEHITAELDPRNGASARVLEKLGFAHVRTVEKNFDYGGIEWCDTGYYELARPGTDA